MHRPTLEQSHALIACIGVMHVEIYCLNLDGRAVYYMLPFTRQAYTGLHSELCIDFMLQSP